MTSWLIRIFAILAAAGFAAAVWFGGPLIAIGDWRPLQTGWARVIVAVPPLIIVAGFYILRYLTTAKRQGILAAGIVAGSDDESRMLQSRMADAIAVLKRASGRKNFLYELPWYIIIGPPGAGKTTALANSGLSFPLAGSGEAQPVPGVGGTRNCDWWFAEDAVLLDTAGRYTTQDSDSRQDKAAWLNFLSLLKTYRGKRPVDGVILALSVEDLMVPDDESLTAHVIEIGNRLQEIRERLETSLPIYVLFTKADLIAGFIEYFGSFDENRRRKVWGCTFPAGRNTMGRLPAEYDALTARLADEATDRLHEERDPLARIAIFGFPAQFAMLKMRVLDFLGRLFEPAGKFGASELRGFYFSSGTQEGTAIDQLVGELARDFGADARPHLSGTGKSFFLHDLLSKVVFLEGGSLSQVAHHHGRAALLRYGGLALIALAASIPLALWSLSFLTNSSLVASTDEAVDLIRSNAGPTLEDMIVSKTDLENVVGPLGSLSALPVGYGNREQPTPIQEAFGLSQRGRLSSASDTAYRLALERLLRPRLILQLEQTIRANIGDPTKLYEPLKIYLMLGGKAPKVDDRLIAAWLEMDWEQNRYPGSNNREGREELRRHLLAMLDLDDAHEPFVALDRSLVEAAQRSMGRMTLAERAAAMVRSASYTASLPDFSVMSHAGPDARLVFETTDGGDLSRLHVPGLYTYAGFNEFYLNQLAAIAQKLVDEAWVIGAGGERGAAEQEQLRLGPDLLEIYGKDFVAAWNGVLDRLKFKAMSQDKPQYLALSAAALATSPVRQLFEAISSETALTREAGPGEPSRPEGPEFAAGLARIGIDLPTRKSQSRAGSAFANAGAQIPGASTEAQFRPFQILVSGPPGQRPIDALVRNFHDIYQNLLLAAAVPTQAERANAALQLQISTLRANASRLPGPLARMVRSIADDFEGEAAETSLAKLNDMLAETVGRPCQEAIANRYPFAAGSVEDVPMADFVAMFAPNGVIDRFFTQYLAPLADLSGQNWDWKQDTRLGRTLSRLALRSLQQAAEIRDAFFQPGSAAPEIRITVTPSSVHGDVDMALLDVNGQVVQSYQTGNVPAQISWPGALQPGSASVSLTPELPGRPSDLRFEGPWALKRLLDAGSVTPNGDSMDARFVIGGRDVAYSVNFGTGPSPFHIPALSGFSCPTSLR
ncbi:MAG TPA: type VI secretion system membrane subunit TssM [Rhizobiaceae bacterium]|nr:type VI secretion system membrane subunit TssM [Rhizobiaceae bacterium]